MHLTAPKVLGAAAALGLSLSLAPTSHATSAPPPGPSTELSTAGRHELPNPLESKRRALRQEALTKIINGQAKPERRGTSTVLKVGSGAESVKADKSGRRTAAKKGKDQYVELSREKTDRIFVVLAEFGNQRDPRYPDKDINPATPGPVTWNGPLHNQIPQPNRADNNRTIWQPDYNRQHYQDLYFGTGGAPGSGKAPESVRQYYERQSSGRYSVSGTVTDWVKVPYNEARYGRSTDPNEGKAGDDPNVCGAVACSNTWNLVDEAVDTWVTEQRAMGRTEAQIKAELKTFDVWDRYDYDGDGNFNEPDGYIDHFQIVHAGGDEADGDPQQGEDAIWSHRWYVDQAGTGSTGPSTNKRGGAQVGTTGLWVGDYTIQPENGGMSVFAHEYGHDLGLPDLYDTNRNDPGGNGVDWWSIMAQSRLSAPNDQGIGTRAGDFGAWEKLQLGWLDYETVLPSQNRTLQLGPHEYNSPRAQAVVAVLPKKPVTTALVQPFAGSKTWWSGSGDDLDNTMTRQVALPAGSPASLTMQAQWDIEDCGSDACDYAYVQVDTGSGWTAIPGSITKAAEGNGIDGKSTGWTPATFDLSAYAGKTIGLRLRYATDGAAGGKGFFADEIAVRSGSTTLVSSGAEASPEGWTLAGFSSVGATVTNSFDNYYIASHRDYVSFDRYLQSGPYNFGYANTKPNFAEHFPYQDGLLVSYWDTSYTNNNTTQHPGNGLILPIDANARPLVRLDGTYWRSRVAGYDAPFSREKSDSITLHVNGQPNYIRGQAAQPTFRDNGQYWYAETPYTGVKVPNNGVNISVLNQQGTTMKVKISQRR
ncbi:immune inhibitor A domain-containing protein [Luteipulveratus flavus]|uniref:Immune inhibitor A n=1 Tax=Luteipulveratus flavus TaxID=3031728 RepID=A0ABT6C2P7_9MICO|nr:immune inhibitor A domain-containing protein [Luteipulveratus sp. YIM 133296]MDF8263090.1 immune inhibitor A [Luteipulveratus sp. YIM 133296]